MFRYSLEDTDSIEQKDNVNNFWIYWQIKKINLKTKYLL